MGIDSGVLMTVVVSVIFAVVIVLLVHFGIRIINYGNTFRQVEHLQVGIVLYDIVHPGRFKSDVADLQGKLRLFHFDHLLGCGIVGFGALTGRHHTVDCIFIAGNLFGKVSLGLYGYGYHLFGRLFSAHENKRRENNRSVICFMSILF